MPLFLLKYWKHGLLIGLAFAAYFAVRGAGYAAAAEKYEAQIKRIEAEAQAERAKAVLAAQEKTLLMGQIAIHESTLALKRRQTTEVVTRTIERAWEERDEAGVQSECHISLGAERLHDDAAANRVPDPSTARRGDDGAAGGVEADQAVRTCTENYATCYEWADNLTQCQGTLRGIYEAYNRTKD